MKPIKLHAIFLVFLALTWSAGAKEYGEVVGNVHKWGTRGSSRVTSVTQSGVDSMITSSTRGNSVWTSVTVGPVLNVKGNVALGSGGTTGHQVDIFGGAAERLLRLSVSDAGALGIVGTGGGTLTFTMPWRINMTAGENFAFSAAATKPMSFSAGGLFSFLDKDASDASRVTIDSSNGAVSAGAITGTSYATAGPYQISLLNKTGATSVVGQIVRADPDVDLGYEIAQVNEDMPIGVVVNAVAADAAGLVATGGIQNVLFKNGVAPARGALVFCSDTAGRADNSATLPVAAIHDREVGICLETKSAGTDVVAKCVIKTK